MRYPPAMEEFSLSMVVEICAGILEDLGMGAQSDFDCQAVEDWVEQHAQGSKEPRIRTLARALWKLDHVKDEASAMALILDALCLEYASELNDTIVSFAEHQTWATKFQEAIHQVAPEFMEDLRSKDADAHDVVMRLLAGALFGLDPKKAENAFLADAAVRRFSAMFSTSASKFLHDLQEEARKEREEAEDDEDDEEDLSMPYGIHYYVLILCGLDGRRELFMGEPPEDAKKELQNHLARMKKTSIIEEEKDVRIAVTMLLSAAMVAFFHTSDEDEEQKALSGAAACLDFLGEQGVVCSMSLRGGSGEILQSFGMMPIPGEFEQSRARARMMPEVMRYETLKEVAWSIQEKMLNCLDS